MQEVENLPDEIKAQRDQRERGHVNEPGFRSAVAGGAEEADAAQGRAQTVEIVSHGEAPLSHSVADRPDDDGQREAADQRRPGELVARRRVHAVTGVPDKMPDAADQMMEERPGEDEQNQPAYERLDERGKDAERRSVGRGGDEKPGEQ